MAAKSSQFNMERFFQALGDNTRLRLLNLMGDQEICVCYFVEILAQGQPKISRHLAYLRRAGIVEARREGKVDALSHRHAAEYWRSPSAAPDACMAEGRSWDAGRPGTPLEGLLQSGEVLSSPRGALANSSRLPMRS